MKKQSAKTSPRQAAPKNISSQKYLELKIPRFPFKNFKPSTLLVIVIVILAFALGILTSRIMSLEESLKNEKGKTPIQAGNNAPAYPTQAPKVDVDPGHLPVIGNGQAKVTIVEFSDFQCPFCKQFIDNTFNQINETYIKTGKVKFTYRHYPLSSIHPNAQKAAEATECANEQDKFWPYHDLLFKNQALWSNLAQTDLVNNFVTYASDLGINSDQFRSCLESNKYQEPVAKDLSEGTQVGVDGTPAFFINGWRLTGAQPFTEFQRLIEQELKK